MVIRERLATLVAAVWAGFVSAAFLGLAFLPQWSLRDAFSEREFALASEAWWREQPFPGDEPSLVVLTDMRCGCAAGESFRRFESEARAVGVQVIRIEAVAGPRWDLAASLPEGSGVDMLLFDRDGRLRLGFLGSNPDHCASASARLRAGLADVEGPRVWPGLCDCG